MINVYGRATFRQVCSIALALASKLNAIADSLAMDTREGLLDTEQLIKNIEGNIKTLQGIVTEYEDITSKAHEKLLFQDD